MVLFYLCVVFFVIKVAPGGTISRSQDDDGAFERTIVSARAHRPRFAKWRIIYSDNQLFFMASITKLNESSFFFMNPKPESPLDSSDGSWIVFAM